KNVAQIWLHRASTPGIADLDSCCKNGIASLSQLYSTLWFTGAVIQQMMEMPGHAWTVESLASIAHMSRASFAQLFRDVSGTTPLAVLTKLRLQIAAQMFSREMLPVVVIAESVGYASESSFHKAFVREFGCTPGEYRERVRQLAP
ncbi:helix-turn-helix domain-containing protein, partial [Escherichia coli]|uniref:helix-turn-helix domain-containing protein n=1 Tax=Escherichia coli TaxID=562 RepID=UPI003EE30D07